MSTHDRPKRSRRYRIIRGIVLVAAALGLLALVGEMAWSYVEAKRLSREVARIKTAGEPLTFAELDAGQPVLSESDDAGPFYEAGIALIRNRDEPSLWDAQKTFATILLEVPASQPGAETVERVNRLLADNGLALDMLDRGAKQPVCSYEIGIEYGMEYSLNRLSEARAAARLLSLRALVRASEDKGDEAAESLIGLLQFKRVFDRQPVMVVHLVATACTALASQDTGIVLGISRPSDRALSQLYDALVATDDPGPPSRVLLAERVYTLQLMHNLIDGREAGLPADKPPLGDQWPVGRFWGQPIGQHMMVDMLRDMDELLQIARQPWPQALAALRTRETGSNFGSILTPPLARGLVLQAASTATARCAAVSILIELYRRRHDSLPETLDQLSPALAPSLPVDPFTGKGLFYRHDGQGFVVYSVGENQTDDGGDVKHSESGKGPADMGIRVRY